MAITYKVFLDQRRARGTDIYPLKLRVTFNRKHKEIPLNINLHPKDWNETTQRVKANHPNAKMITIKVSSSLNEISERALRLEAAGKVYNVDDLVTTHNAGSGGVITFLSFTNSEITRLNEAGKVGNAITYRTASNRLIAYAKRENLRFEQIDYQLLSSFTASLQAEGLTLNAIASYMREIRAVYNKAIKSKIVEAKYYPFDEYKIKTTKTAQRTLSIEQMQRIASLELPCNTPIWHSRNYFLLSFCLIGTNLTDLFKLSFSNVQGERVVFNRSKTKKLYSIWLHPEAKTILTRYEHGQHGRLLPILGIEDKPLVAKKKCLQAIKNINKYLRRVAEMCDIKQEVTSYYARYAWANIARKLGYSKDLIAEALGHEYGNSVTGIYLDSFGNEIIDEANARVIAAVFDA